MEKSRFRVKGLTWNPKVDLLNPNPELPNTETLRPKTPQLRAESRTTRNAKPCQVVLTSRSPRPNALPLEVQKPKQGLLLDPQKREPLALVKRRLPRMDLAKRRRSCKKGLPKMDPKLENPLIITVSREIYNAKFDLQA